MALFRVIGKLASLSIILGVITFLAEIPQRTERQATEQKKANYEAWQIIRANQGQASNGGRTDALQDLHKNGVQLLDVNLAKANLTGINLSGAELENADFTETVLRGANLAEANLSRANLERASGSAGSFKGTDLTYANLRDAVLFNFNLSQANLERANLLNTQLSGCNLRNANLEEANLIDAKLVKDHENNKKTDLTDANLKGIFFSKNTIFPKGIDPMKHNAHLVGPGAKLSGLSLAQFDLGDIDLTGADLSNTNLTNTNLSKVKGLTVEQIKKAEYWEGAIYEPNFRKKLGLSE
jgi:uncharacterized protein YjbI with pentapeptide repeats